MKAITKSPTAVFQALVLVISAWSLSFAADQTKPLSTTPIPKQVTTVPSTNTGPVIQGGTVPRLCSDPAATLVITKSLAQGTATLTLKGTICNKGPGDYSGVVPMQALFYAITWHPPKTPAQEGNWKAISYQDILGKVKNGECRTLTQTYTIPNVVMWGHTAATPTMRPAIKEIGVQVSKKGPVGFSKCEDSNNQNDTGFENVLYMEKL